jgi:hypothetical protein
MVFAGAAAILPPPDVRVIQGAGHGVVSGAAERANAALLGAAPCAT